LANKVSQKINADPGELFAGVVLAWSAIQVVTGKYDLESENMNSESE